MSVIVDLSKYQKGEVDFSKLKGEVDLAILRDQYGYTTKDDQYDFFVSECKKYGIPFDTYAYFAAVNVSDAVAEAQTDIQRMAKESVVAWVDVEEMTKANTNADVQAAYNAYYDTLKKAGFQKVGLYSGEYFYNQHGLAACKKDCLWLASYGTNSGTMQTSHRPQVPGVDLWQYTSKGQLSAIKGDCDLSILIGTKPLSYFTGIVPAPAPKVAPTPAPVKTEAVTPAPAPKATPVPAPTPAPVAPKAPEGFAMPPASVPFPPLTANPEAPTVIEVKKDIVVKNLSGDELGDVQKYVADKGWWFVASKNEDDSLNLEVGIFIVGSTAYNVFKDFLDTEKLTYEEKDVTA